MSTEYSIKKNKKALESIKVLVDLINEEYHPNARIIISSNGAEVLEGLEMVNVDQLPMEN